MADIKIENPIYKNAEQGIIWNKDWEHYLQNSKPGDKLWLRWITFFFTKLHTRGVAGMDMDTLRTEIQIIKLAETKMENQLQNWKHRISWNWEPYLLNGRTGTEIDNHSYKKVELAGIEMDKPIYKKN